MKIQLESTTKVVRVVEDGMSLPARVWEGTTESGIPVHVFITRIAVPNNEDLAQFEAELLECRVPSTDVAAYPRRIIL